MKTDNISIRPRDEPETNNSRKTADKVKPATTGNHKSGDQKHLKSVPQKGKKQGKSTTQRKMSRQTTPRSGKTHSGKADTKMNPLEQAFTKLAKAYVKKGGAKLLKQYFPYLISAYFGNMIGHAYRLAEAPDFFNKLMYMCSHTENFKILPGFHPFDLLIGLITGIGMFFIVWYRRKNAKKFRNGFEYGSARWGTEKDITPFMDEEDFYNNVILTQTERIIMNGFPKGPEYDRNRNVLIIGGSGSGKTRFFVKPNLMQLHSSYIITDPKGTLIGQTGRMFLNAGYKIKVLNTINFKKSMHYNPFAYIHSEKDILTFVNTLIANTKGEGQQSSEDFWTKAEALLYQAYIGYIYYECVEEEQNFKTLIDMLDASETREDDENYENAIDLIFKELEELEPDHFAVRQYAKYKMAAGKTSKSILISCGARLAPFDIKELRELTDYDEMDLDKAGEKKTVMYLIMSDTNKTFNFILALLQSQMFNILCESADDKHGGELPVPVRFILDEFANIGQIPNFEVLISTIRSRGVSASIILQSKSQLKALYKDHAETIINNCDSKIFLGSSEATTLKELSEQLGKETIDMYNTTDTKGMSPTYGVTYQKTGKELMSQDEIAVMNGGECILQLRGVRPFRSKKYDITKHPRYKELSDYNKKYTFDVESYLSTRLRMKKDDQVEVYDLGTIPNK